MVAGENILDHMPLLVGRAGTAPYGEASPDYVLDIGENSAIFRWPALFFE